MTECIDRDAPDNADFHEQSRASNGVRQRPCYASRVGASVGNILGDRYRLVRPIGEGGMGAVWEAVHTVTGKAVALKLLAGKSDDPALRKRLLREARAVCSIAHPHVVPVHDVFELEDGAPALVMDLLHGESLATRLDRESVLETRDVLQIAIDTLSALEAAHAHGIVHRDLKPANIFLANGRAGDAAFEVKLLDFGVAKMTTLGPAHAEAAALTRTDAMIGTPYYMAPEQVYGEKDLDGRSDLWSLGIVMYECLAGTRPTEASNLGQIFKLITVGPLRPLAERAPHVPAGLAKVVASCLERDRNARPKSATALREVLEHLRTMASIEHRELPARRSSPQTSLRWAKGFAVIAATSMIAALAFARHFTNQRHAVLDVPAPLHTVTTSAVTENVTPALDETPAPFGGAPSGNGAPVPPLSTHGSAAPRPTAGRPEPTASSARTRPVLKTPRTVASQSTTEERTAGKVVLTPPF